MVPTLREYTNNSDFHHSVQRVVGNEESRAKATGFGTTRQGQAIAAQYLTQLASLISADRTSGRRDKVVWRVLKDLDDLALRLLIAGISVCAGDHIGTNAVGQKNFRDVALWIGRNLSQNKNELALKDGAWGINMLTALPIFTLGDGDILEMPLTASLDNFLDE